MHVVDYMMIIIILINNGEKMDRFLYGIPTLRQDLEGNIVIIHKYSLAPIETLTYGITKDKEFYLDWEYSELNDEELVSDYRIISKERILKVLDLEIERCKKINEIQFIEKYEEAKKLIISLN